MLADEISSLDELVDSLSRPIQADIDMARRIDGDVIVLGAAGKMGPTLVRRVAAAFSQAERDNKVFAVSRFSDPSAKQEIESSGAIPLAADLTVDGVLDGLPDVPNVIYLVGMKFGSTGQEPMTWAVNTYLPGRVAQRYAGSRIVALSTGNVYGDVDVNSGGSVETDSLHPVGEYAQSCLGRERIFQHFSIANNTPVCLIRLNYAVEARYGVLLDIARKVFDRQPVSLSMGYVNVIWQGDANAACFAALEHCTSPANVLNLTGSERLSVREVAEKFGQRFGVDPILEGTEQSTALLSDSSRYRELLGEPTVTNDDVIALVASWVRSGGQTLGKPTKFEKHDGKF